MGVIRQTSSEAWKEISKSPNELMKAIALPSLLVILLELIPEQFMWSVVGQIATTLVYAVLAIKIHRYVLLSDSERGAETRASDLLHYIGWSTAILVLIGIAMVATAWTGAFVLLVGFLPAFYITSRMSLILPNRALGRRDSVAYLWKLSGNNGWKLTCVLLVPPMVIATLISLATISFNEKLRALVFVTSAVPIIVFSITLLSVAYRNLVEHAERSSHS
ncbi:MAG: hypothetical protein VYE29_04660 [Pseudomonadota bacterium]|nr:hypothetical protein [Pseudomonadota bacterium]